MAMPAEPRKGFWGRQRKPMSSMAPYWIIATSYDEFTGGMFEAMTGMLLDMPRRSDFNRRAVVDTAKSEVQASLEKLARRALAVRVRD
jgi:hypothetical protein